MWRPLVLLLIKYSYQFVMIFSDVLFLPRLARNYEDCLRWFCSLLNNLNGFSPSSCSYVHQLSKFSQRSGRTADQGLVIHPHIYILILRSPALFTVIMISHHSIDISELKFCIYDSNFIETYIHTHIKICNLLHFCYFMILRYAHVRRRTCWKAFSADFLFFIFKS